MNKLVTLLVLVPAIAALILGDPCPMNDPLVRVNKCTDACGDDSCKIDAMGWSGPIVDFYTCKCDNAPLPPPVNVGPKLGDACPVDGQTIIAQECSDTCADACVIKGVASHGGGLPSFYTCGCDKEEPEVVETKQPPVEDAKV